MDMSSSEQTNQKISPEAEPEGVTDLREQVAALIALAISERTDSGRKGKGAAGSIGWIAAVTALLAAVGSSLGASQSLYMSTQISETQRQIIARQERLDLEGRRTSENARIGNLFTFYQEACGQIPSDDTSKWNEYARCIFQTPVGQTPTGDFLQISDPKRVECLKLIKMCGTRSLTSP